MMATYTVLDIRDLAVRYAPASTPVLERLSLALAQGDIGCVVGSSGCGKTTLLRAIAGLVPASSGSIDIGGLRVVGDGIDVPTEKRGVGLVFQDYALFPHLRIDENVAFGLRALPRSERGARVHRLLELVGLQPFARKYPHELSGGQQQRVALARALAPQPDLLLLDEPFSNLDVDLRERLGQDVREIIKRTDTTAVLVTHDQHEAFAIADEIGIMQDGRIEQWDTPYNLYHRPSSRFIADFVGQGVLVPGNVLNGHEVAIEIGTLSGEIPKMCEIGCDRCGKGCSVEVLLRPDDIVHDDASALKAEVARKAFRGADILYTLKLDSGREVLALVPSHHNHAIGEKIGIRLEADHIVAFPPAPEAHDDTRAAA